MKEVFSWHFVIVVLCIRLQTQTYSFREEEKKTASIIVFEYGEFTSSFSDQPTFLPTSSSRFHQPPRILSVSSSVALIKLVLFLNLVHDVFRTFLLRSF